MFRCYDGDFLSCEKIGFLETLLTEKLDCKVRCAHEFYVEFKDEEQELEIGINWLDEDGWEVVEISKDGKNGLWAHPYYPNEVFTDEEANEISEANKGWDTDFQKPIKLSWPETEILKKILPLMQQDNQFYDYGVGYFHWDQDWLSNHASHTSDNMTIQGKKMDWMHD